MNADERDNGVVVVKEPATFGQEEYSEELVGMVYDSLQVIDIPKKGSDNFSQD